MKLEIIKLYNMGFTYSRIKKELGCSKGTISYHLSKFKKNEKLIKEQLMEELIEHIKLNLPKTRSEFDSLYGEKLTHKERKFFYDSFYKKEYKGTRKGYVPKEYYRKKRLEMKQECVNYKGGQCEICGYKKSLSALQFHHIDPEKKDFEVGGAISYKKRPLIWAELDKCILVCANCHAEIHEKQREGSLTTDLI